MYFWAIVQIKTNQQGKYLLFTLQYAVMDHALSFLKADGSHLMH